MRLTESEKIVLKGMKKVAAKRRSNSYRESVMRANLEYLLDIINRECPDLEPMTEGWESKLDSVGYSEILRS